MVKASLIRLSDKTGEEITKYAQDRGIAFATAVRCIVVEHLKESVPAENPTKTKAGTATPNA